MGVTFTYTQGTESKPSSGYENEVSLSFVLSAAGLDEQTECESIASASYGSMKSS